MATVFSVDLYSLYICSAKLVVHFFAECKYRHDNTKWIFTPLEVDNCHGPTYRETFTYIQDSTSPFEVDLGLLSTFAGGFPFTAKGIEITPRDSNPKGIKEGIEQLRYAVVNEALNNVYDRLWGGTDFGVAVFVPLLITTGDMWCMKPGTSLEAIRGARQLEEVADQLDALLLYSLPNKELERYTNHRTSVLLNPLLSEGDEEAIQQYEGLKEHLKSLGSSVPGCYWVVHYRQLGEVIQNMLRLFESSDILITKPPQS